MRSKESLKEMILDSLRRQGFPICKEQIVLPKVLSKEKYRQIHHVAVEKKRILAQPKLQRHESWLIQRIANGSDVIPERISPRLILVRPKSKEELLFRYVSLHWSIPVSSGYGRRLRFLVTDRSNDKLIGIIGIGDPVFSLKDRDNWIAWDVRTKRENMYHVMDAFVLGAVPPYSKLLCGKLVAMLATSNDIRKAFNGRYGRRTTLIRGIVHPAKLVLLTTTSAFGRSSVYNRLRYDGMTYWQSIGFTQGYGEFHFFDGVYDAMREYVASIQDDASQLPTAKHEKWGSGFRNRREVVSKCLKAVGLPNEINKHGIQREIFAAPLGAQSLQYLRGEAPHPQFFDRSVAHLWQVFRDRWLLPRAESDRSYQDFDHSAYRLWKQKV